MGLVTRSWLFSSLRPGVRYLQSLLSCSNLLANKLKVTSNQYLLFFPITFLYSSSLFSDSGFNLWGLEVTFSFSLSLLSVTLSLFTFVFSELHSVAQSYSLFCDSGFTFVVSESHSLSLSYSLFCDSGFIFVVSKSHSFPLFLSLRNSAFTLRGLGISLSLYLRIAGSLLRSWNRSLSLSFTSRVYLRGLTIPLPPFHSHLFF